MKAILLTIIALLVTLTMAASPKKGKLAGHVDIGPISPVQHIGKKDKVPPEMYKRYMVVVTQGGPRNQKMKSHLIRVVANVKLSATGDYSVDLDPGEYQVGVNGASRLLLPSTQGVKIIAGKTTKLNLHVDTGIR